MKPNKQFVGLDLEFWSNVKLLNQKLGYVVRATKANPNPNPMFVIPSVDDVIRVFAENNLNPSKLLQNGAFTNLGQQIIDYMTYRGKVLTIDVQPRLMDKNKAKQLFYQIKQAKDYSCPLPLIKQKGDKKDFAFLTCIVNMLIEDNIGGRSCDYNPKELTMITVNGFPVRTLSRRVDGAFPSTKDPVAIWEIKEYYNTTSFGSRVADGVYETQLDGWELWEAKHNLKRDIQHYLIVDGYSTWWEMGRSYLCRLIDSMHMGLVTEVIFGSEVVDRTPQIVKKW
ncbi:MAG: hypothetical protein SNG35_08890 [Rikenellaceae bacterium]